VCHAAVHETTNWKHFCIALSEWQFHQFIHKDIGKRMLLGLALSSNSHNGFYATSWPGRFSSTKMNTICPGYSKKSRGRVALPFLYLSLALNHLQRNYKNYLANHINSRSPFHPGSHNAEPKDITHRSMCSAMKPTGKSQRNICKSLYWAQNICRLQGIPTNMHAADVVNVLYQNYLASAVTETWCLFEINSERTSGKSRRVSHKCLLIEGLRFDSTTL